MLADLFAKLVARRLVRWAVIALFNLIGFTSVVGIPVVLIIDTLLVLAALQGIFAALRGVLQGAFAALRGTAVEAGHLTVKLLRVTAIGIAVCSFVGVIAALAIPYFATADTAGTAQALSVASSTVPTGTQDESVVRISDVPIARQTQTENAAEHLPALTLTPIHSSIPNVHRVIELIDERNYVGALALIEADADIVEPLNGRTPLTALELDHRPNYYSESDAYRLMKKLITISGGLDQRLNDFGSVLWHQLMYDLGNDPQKFSEVLDILLARGIDINQKNFHGQVLADTATWSYATQDIMIARGACSRFPNPVKPQQLVCAD